MDSRSDGHLDFSLELVRGKTPFLPPQPYGVLDFRLRPTFRWNEALAVVRGRAARAALAPVLFTAGFFQLRTGGQEEIPADIRQPIPMTWSGVGVSRCMLRLSRDTAVLLKKALLGDVLLVEAVADVEME
ncbi:MAG: hypothetical protein M3547_03055, partial [Acidobacteriota bacterium]|nr:hypothetical protein [Acidobacteriota bacterium]